MSDAEYDGLFTRDKPVVFGYHGYPWADTRIRHQSWIREHGTDMPEVADRQWAG